MLSQLFSPLRHYRHKKDGDKKRQRELRDDSEIKRRAQLLLLSTICWSLCLVTRWKITTGHNGDKINILYHIGTGQTHKYLHRCANNVLDSRPKRVNLSSLPVKQYRGHGSWPRLDDQINRTDIRTRGISLGWTEWLTFACFRWICVCCLSVTTFLFLVR